MHQCHICNRKFKKKIDRDRHLFVHDIRDAPNVFICELCDYTASRRSYLEKHFKKHRVVYICCECSEKFASTIRLNQHLSEVHQCSDMDEQWMELFQRCIDSSMFLPEPDGSINDLSQPVGNVGGGRLQIATGTVHSTENVETTQAAAAEAANTGMVVGVPQSEVENHTSQTIGAEEHEVNDTEAVTQNIEESQSATDNIPLPETGDLPQSETGDLPQTETGDLPQPETSDLPQPGDANVPPTEAGVENMQEAEAATECAEQAVIPVQRQGDNVEENMDDEDLDEIEAEIEMIKDYNIYERLSFNQMTMEVFQRLRQTFGNEECEFCGRLFYSRSDYEPHLRTHTGNKTIYNRVTYF